MRVVPITDLQFKDKKVLVRCDFNVPIAEGKIQDPARIDASLDTIRYILEHGGSAVLCSHLGRPKERSAELSLKPVAEYLSIALGQKVKLAPDCVGDHTGKMIDALKPGEALLLENLRFHKEEEANDRDFSHELARHKQVYVNDGFGTAHRAHASTEGVTHHVKDVAAGLLLEREVTQLRAILADPPRPLVAVLGGSKVTDKIAVIERFLELADTVLIGGAMCFPFLHEQGHSVGASMCEEAGLEPARTALAGAGAARAQLRLPVDLGLAEHLSADAPRRDFDGVDVPDGWMGLDIGPRTAAEYAAAITAAGTVFWNGPMGVFELDAFAAGTRTVAEAVAAAPGTTVVGGGTPQLR